MINPFRASQKINLRKVSLFAIVVNVLELFVLLVVVAYMIFMDGTDAGRTTIRILAVISALMAGWGALLDIRQAVTAYRRVHTIVKLEHTNQLMDDLNSKLRAQRHDFLNHLQVVYSLMEMQEYPDAMAYLERVYGEIRAVSSVLRTQSTAVNALLKVKMAACEDSNISLILNVTSPLEDMPIPPWELCCVLSNLLDNAMDAVRDTPEREITLEISENLREFIISIRNRGAAIPLDIRDRIFEAGVTTKGEGHGMGLKIVQQTLAEHGGDIACHNADGETVFTVRIAKHLPEAEPAV